jgi:hypothetical protein
MNDSEAPAKYNVTTVEAVLLEIAAELHPEHLYADALSLKILGDPDDAREVETAVRAVRGLREVGLFEDRNDEIVKPTPAALRAVELLT